MDKVYRNRSGYFERAFGSLDDIADEMRLALKGIEYDTLVGTGLSGTLVVPTLARTLGTLWAIVRKEHSPHASGLIEGEIGQNWLFVDDFISSGETRERVRKVIDGLKVYDWQSGYERQFMTNFVGTYQYERRAPYAFDRY